MQDEICDNPLSNLTPQLSKLVIIICDKSPLLLSAYYLKTDGRGGQTNINCIISAMSLQYQQMPGEKLQGKVWGCFEMSFLMEQRGLVPSSCTLGLGSHQRHHPPARSPKECTDLTAAERLHLRTAPSERWRFWQRFPSWVIKSKPLVFWNLSTTVKAHLL